MDGSIGGSTIEAYLITALALFEAVRRIVQITPGKRDDEIVNNIERAGRKLLDFLAGQHGAADDPGMVKPAKKE